MSGALKSVFGGGDILGALNNIGSMLFPPLAIANSLSNMLTSAIGGAINGAVDKLTQDLGMPKFLGNMIKDMVSNLLPNHMNPGDQQSGDMLKDKVGNKFDDFQKELTSDIVDAFKKYKGEEDKKSGEGYGGGKGGKGGKGGASGSGGAGGTGGKSWFVALMQALGEVQNKQAAKLEKLSKEVSDALGAGDDSAGSKQAQFDKMEEFKAEGKLQDVLANVTKSIGDSIGQALATAGRAQ
jgi:hypothetical protein